MVRHININYNESREDVTVVNEQSEFTKGQKV